MLIRLGLVEQRHKAVLEVLGGQTVTDVARRYGVTRQTVHRWLKSYARAGLGGLVDHPSRPDRCPHPDAASSGSPHRRSQALSSSLGPAHHQPPARATGSIPPGALLCSRRPRSG
jgi:transposase-like protein